MSPASQGAKIRIQGGARLEARVAPHGAGVELRVRLSDDTDRPIGGAEVALRFNPNQSPPPTLPAGAVQPCGEDLVAVTRRPDRQYTLTTSPEGAACVRFDPALSPTLQLRYAGDTHYDGALLQVSTSAQGLTPTLAFQPPPVALALERDEHPIAVATRAEHTALQPREVPVELFLRELDGRELALGTAQVSLGQRAEFRVPAAALGSPGPAQLGARIRTEPGLSAAEALTPVLKTVAVELGLTSPPQAGEPVELWARARGEPVPHGYVEALRGEQSLATAPVSEGRASLPVRLDPADELTARVTIRFLPASPAYRPPPDLQLDLPRPRPSPLGRLALLGAALLITGWLMRAWYRPKRREPRARRPEVPRGTAAVARVGAGPIGGGWSGVVVDAHEHTPVVGAAVTLLVPSFAADAPTRARTDAQGRFELPNALELTALEGVRLLVEAPWHSSLERPLPPPGELSIALVSRRRAALDRLVRWARQAGRPFDGDGAPTPGHVVAAAEARSAREVAEWAQAVERAAYGLTPPDAEVERQLLEEQPRPSSHAGHIQDGYPESPEGS